MTSVLDRLKADFTTRTLALIPLAMVINIVVGQILVQRVLKLPIYLDSIGTVLVAVLAGPLAGALTGALTNILGGIVFSDPVFIPFALTALVIGLVAGVLAQLGWFRRELPRAQGLAVVAVVGALLIIFQFLNSPDMTTKLVLAGVEVALTIVALILTAAGFFPPLVAAGGVLTGMIAAIVSAPIAAFVFGGVTGSGTDLIVAALEASGASILQATLGQGFGSDPFDKLISFLVVWTIIRGAAPRYLLRFPRAEENLPPARMPVTENRLR